MPDVSEALDLWPKPGCIGAMDIWPVGRTARFQAERAKFMGANFAFLK